MKFHRVTYKIRHGKHAGFSWHANGLDASFAMTTFHQFNQHDPSATAHSEEIRLDSVAKPAIIHLLNLFAAHPNNG